MQALETLVAEPVPLERDADGVLRVRGTRVRLDTVLHTYHAGCSPEEIRIKYPSLNLTDVYAVITYYLWHRDEVDAYLETRRTLAEQVQAANEARFPPDGVRERLLARQNVSP